MFQTSGAPPADFGFRAPTLTLSERLTLYLGDHTFQLINLPGHTPYQVAVVVPEEGVIFTSDNVVNGVPPFMHEVLPDKWIASLKKMKRLGARIMVPGHGGICPAQYLDEMIHIVQSWVVAVTRAIESGQTVEQAQQQVNLLERYRGAAERMAMMQRNNVARLYEVLKAKRR
jgi:cyclase